MIEIRPARSDDFEAIATLWHEGWQHGHAGLVPEGLYQFRTLESFRSRALQRIPSTSVAVKKETGRILGFVTINGEELEQFFLHSDARGTGLSGRLMEAGLKMLAASGVKRAYLAVVDGNERAIGFYRKAGWREIGLITYEAQTENGTFPMPCLRFEKDLTAS